MVNQRLFKMNLVRIGLPQWRFAKEELGIPPSTLSEYLRGAKPMPEGLVARIERALKLAPGTLTSRAA
jgi:DNA-binding transcriptional regulator YdaS (Cro superfamily)